MFHRYTVTEDRIEGPVFRAGIRWPRALLYEFCAVVLDYILIRGWKDWGDSSETGKYLVGAFLLILCLFCHLYPLLDRKWFVMDEEGVAYHSLCRTWFMPWESVRHVDLHFPRGAYRRSRNGLICFTTQKGFNMSYDRNLKYRFTETCFGVQYRPEAADFVQRHAKNAGLTEEWARIVREECDRKQS